MVAEFLIQLFIEKIVWLHDVHVAVGKTQSVLHGKIVRVGVLQRSEIPVRTNKEPCTGAFVLTGSKGGPTVRGGKRADQRLR